MPTNPGNDRKVVRRVAGPLRVGKATEDHYLFGEDTFAYWAGELDRAALATNPVTIGMLQQHIDNMSPAWGLRPEARDLVISAWALLRKRAWFEAGGAITPPALGRMRTNIELRAEELPEQQAWDDARINASKLFGYTMPRTYLTGANVADFAAQVRVKANESISELGYLIEELDAAHRRLDITAGANDRLVIARDAAGFRRKALRHFGQCRDHRCHGECRTPGRSGDRRSDLQRRRARYPERCATSSGSLWKNLKKARRVPVTPATMPGRSGNRYRKRSRYRVARSAMSWQAGENKLVTWVVDPGTWPEPA